MSDWKARQATWMADADTQGATGYNDLAESTVNVIGPSMERPYRRAFLHPVSPGLTVVFGIDGDDAAEPSRRGVAELRQRLESAGLAEGGFARYEHRPTTWAMIIKTGNVGLVDRLAWEAWNVANGYRPGFKLLREAQEAASAREYASLRN